MSAVAGLVLAAGRGTRFGAEPKLLAALDGQPIVRRTAAAARAAGLDPVIAVTGHAADRVGAALAGLGIRLVRNPSYADGLSTSLAAGIRALPAEAPAVIVLRGDMPGVAPGTIRARVAAFDGPCAALVPTFAGRRGNPVLLGRRLFPDLCDLTGDSGAGALLRGRADVAELAVDDPAILADIDTRAALDGWAKAGRDPPGPLRTG